MSEITQLSEKIDKIDAKLDRFIDAVEKRFDGVDKRLDGVDKRLDGVDKRLDDHDAHFVNIEKRLDDMQDYMKTEFQMVRVEIASEIRRTQEPILKRLDNLEHIARQNWNVPELSDRLTAVEHEVAKHTLQLKALTSAQ